MTIEKYVYLLFADQKKNIVKNDILDFYINSHGDFTVVGWCKRGEILDVSKK